MLHFETERFTLKTKFDMSKKLKQATEPQHDAKLHVSRWRMFEAIVSLKDGTKRTYISSTLGGEEEAKKAAINNDWSSQAVDAVVAFR